MDMLVAANITQHTQLHDIDTQLHDIDTQSNRSACWLSSAVTANPQRAPRPI